MALIPTVIETAKKLACESLRLNEAIVGKAAELIFGLDSGINREILRWYNLSKLCDPPPPPQTEPFTGDPLCPCKNYDFTVNINWINGSNTPQSNSFTRTGIAAPIRFFWELKQSLTTVSRAADFTFTSADPAACPNYVEFTTDLQITNIREGTTPTYQVVSITESPGQTPGCPPGVPPTDPPPPYDPSDYEFDVDITYKDDTTNRIYIIPVKFQLGELNFNANLDLTIPINVQFKPQFNFDVNLPLNFNIEFNFNTGDVKTYPPTPPGTQPPRLPPPPRYEPPPTTPDPAPPPTPPDIPDPDDDDDPDPALKRVIVGAIVTVAEPANAVKVGQLGQGDNPDVFFPDLGLVSFQIRHRAGVGWTEDIRVKNARQFVPCPWGGGAVNVKGTARQGASITVTPVYGYPEERLTTT